MEWCSHDGAAQSESCAKPGDDLFAIETPMIANWGRNRASFNVWPENARLAFAGLVLFYKSIS
jgi:hypothetical protein